ncbi:type II CAAX prenyl endopeptidase Rce1 family protein [Agromyces sp. NPDC058110]|uniref:CPBP family glutamic-type intramembrane protease n=1 Tax=Agromyces sp. NPDC058110 TaxID=3346345 RepID=UPI0036DDFC16
MTVHVENGSAWKRFWNRGGWWRAVLITVVYAAVYELLGRLVGAVFGGLIDEQNLFGDPSSIFFGVALPIVLAAALLAVFVWSVGWWPGILGRQPIAGRPWMWLAVALVVIPIVIRLFATNWSAYSVAVVLTTLLLGLCIGFAEELITRGVGVNLLRKGGYSERVVMLLSSLLFGLLHSVNVLSGQPVLNVVVTVVYAFGFGAMMYLSMRVTGSLVYAMLLHAATDPTTILATGGIDAHGATSGSDGLLSVAALFNYAYILLALLAIFFVKGRVRPKLAATSAEAPELR